MQAKDKYIRSAKEAVRHLIHSLGLRRRPAHLRPPSRDARFAAIYETGVWTMGEEGLPLSGRGSSLEATSEIRSELPGLLQRLGTQTVLDVGCGDMTWMRTLGCDDYIGVDIVPDVISKNQQTLPERNFYCLDAVVDELPAADTVICREILFHLSFEDASSLLKNLQKSKRRWLIATTDEATAINSDIESGDFRIVNLSKAPFNFPEPEVRIKDDAVATGRSLAVWDFGKLPSA